MRSPIASALALLFAVAPAQSWALDRTDPLMPREPRLRVVDYNPEEVVQVKASVGQNVRIRLHTRERVVDGGVLLSDQALVLYGSGRGERPVDPNNNQNADQPTVNAGPADPSCDRNLCVAVVLNTINIVPREHLEAQPLFLRTEWCPEEGPCQPGEYAFELQTTTSDQAFYGIQFRYTRREDAHRAELGRRQSKARADADREFRRNNPAPTPVSVPGVTARWELGYCGSSPELHPDEAWTDGRTTYLRYNGTRRIPNVYEKRGKDETLAPFAVEPEAWGNVIRVGFVRKTLILRNGDLASCVLNPWADVDSRTEMAVAPILRPLAGQPREPVAGQLRQPVAGLPRRNQPR